MDNSGAAIRLLFDRFAETGAKHAFRLRSGQEFLGWVLDVEEEAALVSWAPSQATAYLRRSPDGRSIAYFSSAAAMFEVIGHLQDSPPDFEVVNLHLAVLPFEAALTYGFVRLRPEDRTRWNRVPLRQGVGQALQGG